MTCCAVDIQAPSLTIEDDKMTPLRPCLLWVTAIGLWHDAG